MGGGGGGGGAVSRGNVGASAAGIPVGARKMVQSLKEIVNLPDQEIYITLKECGMDPSEAVQRLLSQDSFHEVKSKRDKKKEMKETLDSRSRTTNISSDRGVRGGLDHGPRPNFIQSSLNGYGASCGKVAQKKEDGVCSDPSSSSIGSGSSVKRKSTIISENASTEKLARVPGIAEGSSLQTQPSSGYVHGWAGMPGYFSMADIVKMGRPQDKLSGTSTVAENSTHVYNSHIIGESIKHAANHSVNQLRPLEVDQRVNSSDGPHHQAEDITHEPVTRNKHVSHDSWPSVNQPNSINSVMLETLGDATTYGDISKPAIIVDVVQVHEIQHEDEIPEPKHNVDSESSTEQSIKSESISESEILIETEDKFNLDDDSQHNLSSYLSQRHLFQQQVDDINVEISLAATNLQNLSLQKDGLAAPSLEDNPTVIIPRHLQVTNADCSHLSFGSFGSGIGASFHESSQSSALHNNSEVMKVAEDVPAIDHSDVRNSNYYDRDELKSQINEVAVSSVGISTMNYEASSALEPEVIRADALNSAHELQYNFPSLSGYGTSTSTQHSAITFVNQPNNLQMHNIASLSTLMQQYSSSLPGSLLGSTLQPLRDIDLPLSSFLTTQSVSAKHTPATSISGPTISMPEVTASVFSNLQPAPQSSPSTNLTAGHAIPQHLPIHSYSQATLPLGPFANVISYQFLPQNYTYLPSAAFPQAYTSNGPFHQSQAAVHNTGLKYTLPQYKSSTPASSLSQPAAVPSAYGNYSCLTTIPENFALNPSTTSTSAMLGFDEALSTQKEGAHYLHFQQTESLPTWLQGGSSRAVAPLPPNTFYGFQGQNQLNSFRQAQQPLQYGQMSYLNYYQNQLGGQSQEHPQNPSEANENVSQGNPSQQSHQIWQHGY